MVRKISKAKKETVMRTINGLKDHLETNPNDVQSRNHLAKKEAKLASL